MVAVAAMGHEDTDVAVTWLIAGKLKVVVRLPPLAPVGVAG